VKRFYQAAAVAPATPGWQLHLDGKAARTPGRALLVLPNRALGEAVAAEWDSQTETIQPATMPLTRASNTVIDRVADHRGAVVAEIARYGETDLICYRAGFPADLVALQSETWDPLVVWASQRFDAALRVTIGINHAPQPERAVEALSAAVAAATDWQLAPLHTAVTITGSLVIGLALLEDHITADQAWAAGQLDELYQAARWGEDALAAQARAVRRADLDAAVRMMALLRRPD
jgi:chaperone required for assembly of F1-ATPase